MLYIEFQGSQETIDEMNKLSLEQKFDSMYFVKRAWKNSHNSY